VSKEQYEKWDNHIADCDAENMSQLVRMAVKHEIDGKADTSQTAETAIEPDVMGEVTDGIDTLQRSMRDVQTRLSVIEEEIEVTEAMDIEDAVFRALPVPPSDTTAEPNYAEWAVTPDDVAMTTARSTEKVRDVLERMEQRGSTVRSVVGGPDNKHYYWKAE
jgi:hypothetical protein